MDVHVALVETSSVFSFSSFSQLRTGARMIPPPARRNQGNSMILILRAPLVAAGLGCLALAACSEGPAAPSATTPQEVGVLALEPAKLPIIRELPGRIAPTRI